MAVKDHLLKAVDDFNERMHCDLDMQNELGALKRKVNIDLGTEHYSFLLKDSCISHFDEGLLEAPDIQVFSDPKTIDDLFTGKMKPMKAWALRKVVIKGSLEDVMKLRKFF
jgi:putative sterol carrier protein